MPETGFLFRTLDVDGTHRRYQVYIPPDFTPARRWPAILFLHGAGERGNDGLLPTEVGLGAAIRRNAARFPVLGVFPQAPRGRSWRGRTADLALRALDATVAEFNGDPERLYLTGLSMGGYGTWRLGLAHPDRFAALVPVCGALDRPRPAPVPAAHYRRAAEALRHTSVWVFHGRLDDDPPVQEARRIVAALRLLGAPVRYTEYRRLGHGVWTEAYGKPALMEWLLCRSRRVTNESGGSSL